MKVETPQILWNSEGDKNVNAALLSLALLDVSSPSAGEEEGSVSILATAGTSASINLWNNLKFQCSLTRQDGSCNCVRFSPNGLHLAAACEQALVVWSVPSAGVPGREHWLTVTREQDLQFKVVARSGEAFMDLAWSPDSSRIVVGSIDHTVVVCEYLPDQGAGSWRTLCRNECHSHFVQGVAYDPLNLYVASMSSDRTVRVHGGGAKSRPSKKGRKAAAASAALPPPALTASKENAELQASAGSISAGASATNVPGTLLPAVVTSAGSASGAPAAFAVAAADSRKLEMTKSKLIKYHRMAAPPDENGNQPGQQIQKHLYQDEASLESFVRRLSFTSDGAFLVTPAAQWWSSTTTNPASPEAAMPPPPMPQPQNATLVFSRHKWDEPCRILVGAHKPSIAVRPCPVLFELPDETKENKTSAGLPYRSVFCVLTWDSVLVYDTFHAHPLAVVSGLHYCNLVDAAWSLDGRTLFVCSTDGYVSIVRFDEGELGRAYCPPLPSSSFSVTASSAAAPADESGSAVVLPRTVLPRPGAPTLPACEPGCTSIEAPPCKRAKLLEKEDEDESLSIAIAQQQHKSLLDLNQLSIQEPKAKKRIQPTPILSN